MVDHKINELPGFRPHFMIHLPRLPDHIIVIPGRLCVPVRKNKLFIENFDFIYSDALRLCFIQFLAKRDDFFPYLFPERFHFLLAIVPPPLLFVAKRDKILMSQRFSHFVAQIYQLRKNVLQFVFVSPIEIGICTKSLFANLTVLVFKKLLNPVQVIGFAPERNLGSGHQLLVTGGEFRFLL